MVSGAVALERRDYRGHRGSIMVASEQESRLRHRFRQVLPATVGIPADYDKAVEQALVYMRAISIGADGAEFRVQGVSNKTVLHPLYKMPFWLALFELWKAANPISRMFVYTEQHSCAFRALLFP